MKHYQFFRVFTALSVVALSFFSFALTVQAMGTATVGTTLTFQPPNPVLVGSPAVVVLQLISSKGEPVVDQRVELFVNGERERQARTDADGNVSMTVRRDEAGTYALSAVFKGSKAPSLGSSKADADLVVTSALIEVHVTPALPNIRFALDDQVFSSDDYGVARIEVAKAGTYQLELLPLETNDPDIQMAFGRWADDYFLPSREIEIPLRKPLEVGLEVSYQAGQTFVDLDGKPVDFSRITSITLKGSNGATYTFDDNLPHWLPAGRVIRLNNGLEETKILYSVISVIIDGSNVVSQAQQRFYVHPNDVWTVKLLLYSAGFTARDALFRFPIGTGIRMEYPDGDVQTFNFNSNNEHTSTGLARGIYRVTVIGAEGFAPPTPIALSRNQDVELMVFSYLDMGVLLSIGVILALGLLFFGRPHLLRETVTFPVRVISQIRKFRPVVVKEFYYKVIAVGFRIVSKKGNVRLEYNNNATSLDSTTYVESEIANSSAFYQTESNETVSADEIAVAFPNSSLDEGGSPEHKDVSAAIEEQNDSAMELSQPETMASTREAELPSLEPAQNDLVAATVESPANETETNPAIPAEAAHTCQVCGSSQLVKKETKRPSQQRYQCQVCGSSNNFGAKRIRKHRQKNRVESLI
jgi:predicted RNA-binding Zn-ribbon protein involved in translation (DUF1610 family)